VRDREHVHARVGRELSRHPEDTPAPVRRDQPTARHQLGRDDERAGPLELFAQGDHRGRPVRVEFSVCLTYDRRVPESRLQVLDADGARAVEVVCDAIVPGSARVRPAVYVDALLARMEPDAQAAALAAFTSMADGGVAAYAGTPEFMQVRALAIE